MSHSNVKKTLFIPKFSRELKLNISLIFVVMLMTIISLLYLVYIQHIFIQETQNDVSELLVKAGHLDTSRQKQDFHSHKVFRF